MKNELYYHKINNKIYKVICLAANMIKVTKDDEDCIVYQDIFDNRYFIRDTKSFYEMMTKTSLLDISNIKDKIEKVICNMSIIQTLNLYEHVTSRKIIDNIIIDDTKYYITNE